MKKIRYQSIDSDAVSKHWMLKLTRLKTTSWTILLFLCVTVTLYIFGRSYLNGAAWYMDGNNLTTTGFHEEESLIRRLPGCIIIGARKAGTRALLQFLNVHPFIRIPAKEVHFFDNDDNYSLGLDWYRSRMPPSFEYQVTVEKTPAYFHTPWVPKRIRAMNHSIKILLIVRDPIKRAVSDWLQLDLKKRRLGESDLRTFEQMTVFEKHGQLRVREGYGAIKRSVYYRFMERWFEVFDRSNIRVIDGEKFVKNPIAVLKPLERFLNLPPNLSQEMFYFNHTRGFFCMRKKMVNRCLGPTKGRPHPAINRTVIRRLKQYFFPHNEKFCELVAKKFSWCRRKWLRSFV